MSSFCLIHHEFVWSIVYSINDDHPFNFAGPSGDGVVILLPEDYLNSDQMIALQGWMLDKEHLQPGKCLGQGQFGKVFLGNLTMKSGGTREVAFKTMKSKCQSEK